MKCELKYMYHTHKKIIKNIDIKEEIKHWRRYVVIFILVSVVGYFTYWISSYILLLVLFAYLYYEAHLWCKNKT